MKLMIELLSDLCTYSGETYNSFVDIDVVYDDDGFPYIPAKRLKGCIREACLELVEFGTVSQEAYESIFGKEGNQSTIFSLSNAYIKGYQQMKEDVEKEADAVLSHPQNVLGLFSYVRTQTSIDMDTGVAKDNSLRTMRVVKKGVVFEADLQFADGQEKSLMETALLAAKMVKHMGVSRTRGLGLVKMTVEEQDSITQEIDNTLSFYDKNRITYSITLNAPMLCKSVEGNQARTQHYIEGGKILGMLAGSLGQEAFRQMMGQQSYEKGNEIVVSNAYIAAHGKRSVPVSASLQKKKDQTFDAAGQMKVIDLLCEQKTTEQYTSVGIEYADPDGVVQTVETEINYHHRRPDDKGIGRATGEDNSSFYQIESMRKGQTFQGYIYADREQAQLITKALSKNRHTRMGQSRSAEYGAVDLTIDEIVPVKAETCNVKEFVLKLNAPMILYNEAGVYAADVKELETYLQEFLNAPALKVEKAFLTYETIGGFNVTWGRRKPTFTALGKGTVCLIRAEQGVDIGKLQGAFLGERVSEGYGEVEVTKQAVPEYTFVKWRQENREDASWQPKTEIISKLAHMQSRKEIESIARAKAEQKGNLKKNDAGIDSCIAKLSMIAKAEKTVEDMRQQVDGLEFGNKKKLANDMLQDIESFIASYESPYESKLHAEDRLSRELLYQIFTAAYLQQMKYRLRPGREERRR